MTNKQLTSYNKYKNKKTTLDGIRFDSRKEANRYAELKLLERGGVITNLQTQPCFELQPKFEKNGEKYRAIKYCADFSYMENGKPVVEDVKGKETDVFKLKHKMFEYINPTVTLTIIYK